MLLARCSGTRGKLCFVSLLMSNKTIATVFMLYQYLCYMMYEMRRRNPKATLLPTEGIFNLPHNKGMV